MDKPGCFGHIVTYRSDKQICDPCEHKQECAESVSDRLETLKRLNRDPDIASMIPGRTDALAKPETPSASRLGAALAMDSRGTMTKKAQEVHQTLLKRDIDLSKCLLTRVNPVAKPAFLKVALDELLLHGGYDKHGLKDTFMESFDWTTGTASSHVGIVTSLLMGLKMVTVSGRTVSAREVT